MAAGFLLNIPCKKVPIGQYTVSLASNKWGKRLSSAANKWEKDYMQQPRNGGKRLSSAANKWEKDYPQHPTNGKKDYPYPQTNNKRGQKHNHQQLNTSHQIPHTDFPIQAHSPFQFHALQSNTVAVAARTTCSLSLGRNLGLSSAQLHLSGERLAAKCQGNIRWAKHNREACLMGKTQ